MRRSMIAIILLGMFTPLPAQVDTQRAQAWFAEADSMCRADNGQLWGVSLCGPMVIADRSTQTRATNQPAPEGPAPPLVGLVNAPVKWGDQRWAAYTWQNFPADDRPARGRLLIHELFHRVQPQLGMYLIQPSNDHLDELEGRYWLILEWRALGRALASSDVDRRTAIADAIGFRARRHQLYPEMSVREHADEIREGLAEYTGTVIAAESAAAAVADAITQLQRVETAPTFVRTFGYASGTAYGLLLDAYDPGWTHRFRPTDNLGMLLQVGAHVAPQKDPDAAALRYDGRNLREAELQRDAEQKQRVLALRARFVDGPLVIVPRVSGGMLVTTGATPIPGIGTVYREYRLTAEWGTIAATNGILDVTADATLRVPGPATVDGSSIRGDGWVITVNPGWAARPDVREGDIRVVRAP